MTDFPHRSVKKDVMESEERSAQGSNPEPVKPSPAHPAIKRNAFLELMSPKPVKSTKTTTSSDSSSHPEPEQTVTNPPALTKSRFHARHANRTPTDPRSGLLAYIENPTSFPSSTVLRITPDTVLIRDLYPKATIHLLLLSRSPSHYNLHPHDAFTDPSFISLMQREAASATTLAASELSRLLSPHSQADQARTESMNQHPPPSPSSLPQGRNYLTDLQVGVHAHPSMSHLHVHIISRDMHSPAMKHRKHYNSFTTDFFIPLADYPLSDSDPRRDTAVQNANLKRDFTCWRCGRGFGNKFARLKEHLETEWKEWRAE